MTEGATDTATAEPLPVTEDVPTVAAATPREWVMANLFNSWGNAVLTAVFGLLIAVVAFRGVRFLFVSGRWEIIRVNLTNFMLGRFPRDELYRPWIAIYVAAFLFGPVVGTFAADLRTGRR